MLCLNYLTRGSAPLDPRSWRRDQKSTFRNGWGKFCSIVPEGFSDGTDSPSWFQGRGKERRFLEKKMAGELRSDPRRSEVKAAMGLKSWKAQKGLKWKKENLWRDFLLSKKMTTSFNETTSSRQNPLNPSNPTNPSSDNATERKKS